MIKQPILSELNFFITTVSNLTRAKPKEIPLQLVRSSLNLLDVLPSARDVVFDCFALIFDISVDHYINSLDKDNLVSRQDDEVINDIVDAIENLISKGSNAWPPLISIWSLRLLGKLSDKTIPRRQSVTDIATASNLWLGSETIRCLLHISATTFDKLNRDETKMYINTLLTNFTKYSPKFDWVVANLGSCFPLKIISEIMYCGLNKFSININTILDSEVAVLGYLSALHQKEFKLALCELLETATNPLKAKDAQPNPNAIPYLIHLCRLSEILLQPIVTVFLDLFDDSLISNLSQQSKFWVQNYNVRELLSLMTDLSIKINQNGTKILLKLSTIAGKYSWCYELLEYIFYELESLSLNGRTCSLLQDVMKNESKIMLWKSCCSDNPVEHSTSVRLILLVSSDKTPLIYHQTIAELLASPTTTSYSSLGCLVKILGGPSGTLDVPTVVPGLELALEQFFMVDKRKQKDYDTICYNILKNLVYIVRIEKKNTCPNLRRMPLSKSCEQCLTKILNIFNKLIDRVMVNIEFMKPYTVYENTTIIKQTKPDSMDIDINKSHFKKLKAESDEEGLIEDEDHECKNINIIQQQAHLMIKLLDNLELKRDNLPMDVVNVLKISQLTVKYFFWNLTEKNPITRMTAMNHVFSILGRQCSNKSAKGAALIDLLEGSLYKYSNLFGGENMSPNCEEKLTKCDGLLIAMNQNLGTSSHTNRLILHGGVIGKGPREPSKETELPDVDIQNLLLKALTACCKDEKHGGVIIGFNTIALLLVEMVSPDVMYNGLPWLEEEFSKVTMERDLQIRRTFKNSPILWSILEHVATYRPALCFTSVLFRALCASVLHQWQAKSVEKTTNLLKSDLMFVTVKLLEIMSLGQFIPPPLSFFHCVIEHFEPSEIAVVLKECIWNYMKENVPSPLPFQRDANGFQWREVPKIKSRIKDDILRYMMERKLPQLGNYYYSMFVLPDKYESLQQIEDVNVALPGPSNENKTTEKI